MNPQIKYVLISFVFFLVACGGYWFVYDKVKSNSIEAGELELAWQSESLRTYDLNALARTISSVEDSIGMLGKHFVHPYDIVAFLDYLERMGSSVGVKAEIISVDELKEGSGSVLMLGVRATGPFTAIYKFLTLVENAQYEMEVLSMDLKRQEADNALRNPMWGATFRIKLLSYVP